MALPASPSAALGTPGNRTRCSEGIYCGVLGGVRSTVAVCAAARADSGEGGGKGSRDGG